MKLKLTLEYEGTGFRGWAAQPGLRTVEGALQEALAGVYAGPPLRGGSILWESSTRLRS